MLAPHRRFVRTTLCCALATFGAGCSEPITAPEREVPDVAAVIREIVPVPSPLRLTYGYWMLPPLPPLTPAGCAFAAQSESFVCTPIVLDGLTTTRSLIFRDAEGRPQSAIHRDRTASIELTTRMSGAFTPPATMMQAFSPLDVTARHDLTMTGVPAGAHTLDGTSHVEVSGMISVTGGPMLPFRYTSDQKVIALAIPAAQDSAPRWPTSGTIALEAVEIPTGPGNRELRWIVRAVFIGGGMAKISVTGEGSDFLDGRTIDLARYLAH